MLGEHSKRAEVGYHAGKPIESVVYCLMKRAYFALLLIEGGILHLKHAK